MNNKRNVLNKKAFFEIEIHKVVFLHEIDQNR